MRLPVLSLTLLLGALLSAQDAASLAKKGEDAFAAKLHDDAVQAYIQAIKLTPNSADL